ncbi:hypothetical protein [Streptomyces sp. ISL-11]|uniref:hypothetical protein n=1 Tax=Streptomyces sp. ISL-11 TaxID=2819174 RepID=UPI001BE706AE|nr:hypothetical protein [Streptomyces sp. ISL-11]MBT2385141.1 hypothetical protein [Streptomyces sp. ISL-11]
MRLAGLGFVDLLQPAAGRAGQGCQLPVLLRIVRSGGPGGVGSGVMVIAQQSSLAVGVATLGTLFPAVSPGLGTGTRWW